ncbi:MAG: PLD nuclease N-terminal domain-containing protein [Planctomycetota bacterium]
MAAIQALFIGIALAGLLSFIFTVWMLFDCIRNESSEGNDKLVWVVLMLAAPFFGSLAYYLIRRPARLKSEAPELATLR